VNILLLGTKVLTSDVYDPVLASQDLGYHALVNSFEGLSDTMLLIRFDPVQEQVSVLSIPRDTRAYVDGVGLTKINEANLLGGPALSAQAVSELLNGVPIDRYLRVNVQGVEALIDALGGSRSMYPRI
jgi:LCP family protein required for cell wall assembly